MVERRAGVKVTDRRMFTDSGELREEYRFLEGQKARERQKPRKQAPEPPPGPTATPPSRAPEGFQDLVAALAEPAMVLLGEVPMPDGQSAENLPEARRRIDLLAVFEEVTRGNIPAHETTWLEGLVAQLRMLYVQKTGSN